jgi:hypothetical protein
MKIVTPEQMNEIDSLCINEIGIPGIVLMENAALKTLEMYGDKISLYLPARVITGEMLLQLQGTYITRAQMLKCTLLPKRKT